MRAKRSGGGFVILTAAIGLASLLGAQEPEFRSVDNPFQEEFEYGVGDELEVGVDIAGVRWRLMRLAVRGGREIDPSSEMQVELTLEFENRSPNDARAQVVVLLEDSNGSPLDRITGSSVRIGDGRFKEDVQRFRVAGASLEATAKVYLFCEVEF